MGVHALPIVCDRAAVDDELFISSVPGAVVLHRGPTHFRRQAVNQHSEC